MGMSFALKVLTQISQFEQIILSLRFAIVFKFVFTLISLLFSSFQFVSNLFIFIRFIEIEINLSLFLLYKWNKLELEIKMYYFWCPPAHGL